MKIDWQKDPSNGRWNMNEIPGSEKTCALVIAINPASHRPI